MATSFQWTATWVIPRAKQWAVLITPSESFKKDYQLLDTNSIDVYDVRFDGVSDATRNSIVAHYNGQATGPYAAFEWATVPTYLNTGGTTMTVRYVPDTYKEEPQSRYWMIQLSFEKDV